VELTRTNKHNATVFAMLVGIVSTQNATCALTASNKFTCCDASNGVEFDIEMTSPETFVAAPGCRRKTGTVDAVHYARYGSSRQLVVLAVKLNKTADIVANCLLFLRLDFILKHQCTAFTSITPKTMSL